MAEMKTEFFPIPPRSPDLNQIENMFTLVGDNLRADALRFQISKESFEGFQTRVFATIRSIPITTIDKTISSMDNRLFVLLKNGGMRTKY